MCVEVAMKIDIGRSIGWHLDQATLKITDRIYDGCDSYPWREVYALFPVKLLNGKYAWMRKVYKRKFWVIYNNGFHMEPEVEYGDLFDVMMNPCDGNNN